MRRSRCCRSAPISASPRWSTPIGASTARSERTSSGATNELNRRSFQLLAKNVNIAFAPPSRRTVSLVWHGGCFACPVLGRPMSFRPFTSESYAQDERPEAWRDVLNAVGLQPASGSSFYDGHATASHRNAAGIALTRMSAGSQSVTPLPHSTEDLPIALVPIEDGVVLKCGAGHRIVPVGHLLLLPRSADWSVVFQRDMRAIVLSVSSDALHGRIAGKPRLR